LNLSRLKNLRHGTPKIRARHRARGRHHRKEYGKGSIMRYKEGRRNDGSRSSVGQIGLGQSRSHRRLPAVDASSRLRPRVERKKQRSNLHDDRGSAGRRAACGVIDAEHALDPQCPEAGVKDDEYSSVNQTTEASARDRACSCALGRSISSNRTVAALCPKRRSKAKWATGHVGLAGAAHEPGAPQVKGRSRLQQLDSLINQMRMKSGVMFGKSEDDHGRVKPSSFTAAYPRHRRIGAIKKPRAGGKDPAVVGNRTRSRS